MISEEQQEQAALYALGTLDADEAASFERETGADGGLRTLAEELCEAAASLARTDTGDAAPRAGLRERVLACVAEEKHGRPAAGKVIAGPWMRWVPWSVAAMLAICCGALGVLCWNLVDSEIGQSHQLIAAERRMQTAEAELVAARNARSESVALGQLVFCSLESVPTPQQTGPQAAVLWDAAHRRGRLRVTKLSPPADGKDYQLWTVENGHKDPVNAGVVKVGPDNSAEVEFQPQGDDGKAAVVAFALSVERAGGVPKNEGPILFLGKLQP